MQEARYLKFTSFSKIVFWDYYSINNKNTITSNFPIIKLKEVLRQRKESILIDDDLEYKRCRVKIHTKGIVLRDVVFGKEIKTKKQQLCQVDDFLVAEIDAKVGGYGIVPNNLENAIVSSHYFLFEINRNKLSPEFLNLVIKQHDFSKQIKATGSTNYAAIRPYHVLEYEIPLPTLEEQNEMINAYNKKLRLAAEMEQAAENLKNKMEKYFFDNLGISTNQQVKLKNKGLRYVNYSQIHKWGLDFIGIDSDSDLNYKEIKIKEFCKISSGGTPSRSRKEFYYRGTIPWIKTGELNNDIIYDTEEKITIDALKNSSAKLYSKDSLIIAMYGATIGKTAKLGVEASTNQACAVLFDIDQSVIDIDYLWEYLQTQTSNLKKMAYGSAQPNLNAGIISNFRVPVPPIEKQKEISSYIKTVKSQIQDFNATSLKNKEDAIKELGNQIFN